MALPLKQDFRTAIFRRVVQALQTDPELRRVVETWRSWTGLPDDNLPPTSGDLPWVRLTPIGLGTGRSDNDGGTQVLTADFLVRIETEIAGTDVDDNINIWGAIHQAIYPRDPATRAQLDAALSELGVEDRIITQPGFGIHQVGWGGVVVRETQTTGPLNIHAIGDLKICCHIPA